MRIEGRQARAGVFAWGTDGVPRRWSEDHDFRCLLRTWDSEGVFSEGVPGLRLLLFFFFGLFQLASCGLFCASIHSFIYRFSDI